MPFKSTLFGAAEMALRDGTVEKVFIQPVAITYRACMACRWAGSTVRWPPGSATWIWCRIWRRCLREGAIDVDVHFGDAGRVHRRAATARRWPATMEGQVRKMVATALRDTRPPSRAN